MANQDGQVSPALHLNAPGGRPEASHSLSLSLHPPPVCNLGMIIILAYLTGFS